ncbi:hypothetical protein ILUMI_05669 [Ignelater luminosus]|uniref:RAP domain-containing protein n=1 Tax=Ignelater luminosus TaxID=2038154 RepID=A0A8K0DH84_IGNLU|nr:hypothetical protein ILUMI_05669 [Ignelater luminosus]
MKMFKITYNLIRYTKSSSGISQGLLWFNNFSSVPNTATVRSVETDVTNETNMQSKKKLNNLEHPLAPPKSYNALVSAAFASLRSENPLSDIKTPFTDGRISKATTADELLSISEGSGVSRRHALKVVSILAEWSASGKVNLSEFESDPRFIRLCKILTRTNQNGKTKTLPGLRSEDLSTIVNIAADDEAAKLIASISLPQMVKVMSTLASKKRRSTPLLRSLAFNITRSMEQLDLKQSADLMYSMAMLNFIDENLLQKVCTDVCAALLESVKSSAVIGSILTSLGHLRYKDKGILDALSKWIMENSSECRPQDIFSLFITLAILDHQPANSKDLFQTLIPQLNITEANRPTIWLDIVWSLVVLNQATPEHISSVLDDSFVKKIEEDAALTIASKLKLLNINSACELLMKNYNGPKLAAESNIRDAIATRSKSKEAMVSSVQDSLSNLFTPQTHLKTNINTLMGFYIDAELAVDKKCNPLPLNKQDTSDQIKVAVMTHNYHDTCRGRTEPTGITSLFARLLEAQGYRILTVPYTEFSPRDKLASRVKYLETKLKALVQ